MTRKGNKVETYFNMHKWGFWAEEKIVQDLSPWEEGMETEPLDCSCYPLPAWFCRCIDNTSWVVLSKYAAWAKALRVHLQFNCHPAPARYLHHAVVQKQIWKGKKNK